MMSFRAKLLPDSGSWTAFNCHIPLFSFNLEHLLSPSLSFTALALKIMGQQSYRMSGFNILELSGELMIIPALNSELAFVVYPQICILNKVPQIILMLMICTFRLTTLGTIVRVGGRPSTWDLAHPTLIHPEQLSCTIFLSIMVCYFKNKKKFF